MLGYGLYWDNIGIMEKKIETTIWGFGFKLSAIPGSKAIQNFPKSPELNALNRKTFQVGYCP